MKPEKTGPPYPLLLAVALAMAYWVLESLLHAYVWHHTSGLIMALQAGHDPNEIWMRLTIVVLILGFGLYMQRSMRRENRLRHMLEEQLQKRMEELERFSKAAVDREFRIKELRDETEALRRKMEELNL